ncbi:MAG TPA: PAS domain S-box protein [Thermoanaerobaculia bacterium]|nr:PAS domain S-box protein [Thermoanaerobaculia bacterium]
MNTKILVVEDDRAIVKIYRLLLGRLGMEMDQANTAAEALEFAETDDYGLMILDLGLPGGVDGAQLLGLLEEQGKALPTVIITASTDLQSATELMPFRVSSYHVKSPATFEALERIITEALQIEELRARLRVAERDAQAAQSRIAFVLAHLELAILFTTPEGLVQEWNRGAEDTFRVDASDIIGKPIWTLFAQPDADVMRDSWLELLENPGVWSQKVHIHRSPAGEFAAEWDLSVIRDGKRIAGVAAVARVITQRREAELRSRVLFEQSLSGIFVIDSATGTVIEANRVGAAYFGMAPDELEGRQFERWFSETDQPVIRGKLSHAGATFAQSAGMSHAVRSDGSTFSFGYTATAIAMAGRSAVLVTGRDLSEVQAAEMRYREFFQNAIEAVLITDQATHQILDCNPAFERLMGSGREDLVRRTMIDLAGERDAESLRRRLDQLSALTPGFHLDLEATLHRSDQRLVSVELRSGPFLLSGRAVLVSFIRDLTAERAAEERHRQIFLRGYDPIAIFAKDSGLLVDANPVFESLSGFTLDELKAVPIDALIVNEHGESLLERPDTGRTEPGAEISLFLVAREGASIPSSARVSELTLGEQSLVMVTLRDLRPELRAAEMERSLTHAQKMQSLGQMASGIAHDFNNTLMAALPWADLLRRKYPEDEAIQRSSEHIRKAVHRAKDVTRQLLEFAQPRRPTMTEVSPAQLLEDQMRIIRPALPPEVVIEMGRIDTSIRINADPTHLSQMLLNLSLNARDAMPGGGVLQFDVRSLSPRETELWGLGAGPWAAMVVKDNGTGIQEDILDKIFDPFFTTKEVGKGPGLGLSVVHRLIREHEGVVFVESEEGKGTTFYLIIPQVGEPADDQSRPEVSSGRLTGKTVLIIDDEPDVAEGLEILLDGEGATTRSEPTGPAALSLLREGMVPDFIILDLGLPEMPGEMVYKQIREVLPRVPILISSGYAERERILSLMGDPFSRFIQKPYDVESLLQEFISLMLTRFTGPS